MSHKQDIDIDTEILDTDIQKEQMHIDLHMILKNTFGYDSYRPQQLEIIETMLENNDMLVLMPTGAGKSLCFQIPALYEDGVTIIISPLLSLIYDQIADLAVRGVVAHGCSSTSTVSMDDVFDDVNNGHCNLVYTTPETCNKSVVFQTKLREVYDAGLLRRFVLDEAHCISCWGHSFRSDYLHLKLREWYPDIPIVAFTATATKLVSADIINLLHLELPYISSTTFVKDNIEYSIIRKDENGWGYVGRTVSHKICSEGYERVSGIVYCLSRKECEFLSKYLRGRGLSVEYYHAMMSREDRERVQDDWRAGRVKIIVATIAFALGINKRDVRFVIHTSMPKSVEGYYQQTGRAGRDGRPCKCILYYSRKDAETLLKMDESGDQVSSAPDFSVDMTCEGSDVPEVKPPIAPTTVEERVEDMYSICENRTDCIKVQLCNYLGEYGVSGCRGRYDSKPCMNCKVLRHRDLAPAEKTVDVIYSKLPCSKTEFKTKIQRRVLNELLNQGYLDTYVEDKVELVYTLRDKPEAFTVEL